MGSMLKEQFEGEIKDSEAKEYKEFSYKLFQHGDYRVRSSNGGFCCPFCSITDEDSYNYAHLLQHAIRTAEASSTSGKLRIKHSAMARYLAVDLASQVNAGEHQNQPSHDDDDEWVAASRKRLRLDTRIKREKEALDEVGGLQRRMNEMNALITRERASYVELQRVCKQSEEALDKASSFERKMNEMRDEANALITKELRSINDELQRTRQELIKKSLNNLLKENWGSDYLLAREHRTRKDLIEGLNDWHNDRSCGVGTKQIGELDANVFKTAWRKRFPSGAVETNGGVLLCSMWQTFLSSLPWQQLQLDVDQAKKSKVKEDQTLRWLKEEWGDEAYNAVVAAFMDLLEYDPHEVWNFKENRKAEVEEVVGWVRSGRAQLVELE